MTPVKHKANEPAVVERIVSLLIDKNIEQNAYGRFPRPAGP